MVQNQLTFTVMEESELILVPTKVDDIPTRTCETVDVEEVVGISYYFVSSD